MHSTATWTNPFKDTENSTWSLFIISTNGLFVSHLYIALRTGKDELTAQQMASLIAAINAEGDLPIAPLDQWNDVQNNPDVKFYQRTHPEMRDYANASLQASPVEEVTYEFIRMRQTYKGDTFRYVGTTLENSGTAIAAKYPTSSQLLDYTFPSRSAQTTELNDKSEEDEKTFDSPDGLRLKDIASIESQQSQNERALPPVENTVMRYQMLIAPPLSTQSLTAADPGAYTGEARDGVYTINYRVSDNLPWHETSQGRMVNFTGGGSYFRAIRNLGRSYVDIICNEWEVGVTAFTGLNSNASIQQENRTGIEYVAQPGSRYSSLQDDAPCYDPLPLTVAQRVAMATKSGYPAAYNDWGKMWGVIKGIIPTLAGFVPGIGPILSRIAPTVIKAGENLVNRWRK